MNIFKHNLASSKRHGLSIIEVLTSIVVALIGVFGVLAMIPFSVKQTQSGLDQDAATSMARNAMSSFEAAGFKMVSGLNNDQLNWTADAAPGLAGTRLAAVPTSPLVCIDPLGITEQDGLYDTFPFNSRLPSMDEFPEPLSMPTVNLLRTGGSAFDRADARRMFRLNDDLVFEESDNPLNQDADLLGPVQLYNEGANGLLNRQANGTVSWCAIAQPIVNNPLAVEVDSYKFHVLVFKKRITDSTVPESAMAAAQVTFPTNFAQPLSNVTIAAPLDESIRRNDWVMLINQRNGAEPIAFRTRIAFARVSNLSDVGDGTSNLTLDGPDFDFSNGTTYIVHLRDVVAVFPRTVNLEETSKWIAN